MPNIKLQSEYPDLNKYRNIFGNIYYCKKDTGIIHNPYGPAYICEDVENGYVEYLIEDEIHRLDGPARIYADGKEFYYINGKQLSKGEFEKHPERLKYLGKEYLLCLK